MLVVAMRATQPLMVMQRLTVPSKDTETRWRGSLKPSEMGSRNGAAM